MIRAILFDFGGTLDSDGLHWLDRFYHLYDKNAPQSISKELVKEAFYWADSQADLDASIKTSGLRSMMDRHVFWQFQKLNIHNPTLQAKMADDFVRPSERILHRNRRILEKLSHSGLKLGIISNFYGNIEALCKEFGFLPYMNVILDSAVIGLKKPDPQLFALALTKLGLPSEQVAFVGDNFDRDMTPAKSAGMKTYWLVGDQEKTPPQTSKVDVVLHSLEDLLHEFKSSPISSSVQSEKIH